MAERLSRGDIWLYAFSRPDKQRPVLVLSRQDVIPLLSTVMVAPITSTIRGAPSEVIVGIDEGLKHDSAANLDHVQTVSKTLLRRRLGRAKPETMRAVCRALAIAAGCSAG
jgi:mRNA interferase MazF